MQRSEHDRVEEGSVKGNSKEGIKKLQELKEEVEKYRPDLVINKVPKGELKLFKELCKDEFDGNYGMGLKFLVMDFLNDVKYTDCVIRLQNLESIVKNIEYDNSNQKPSSDDIKTLDGNIIKVTK